MMRVDRTGAAGTRNRAVRASPLLVASCSALALLVIVVAAAVALLLPSRAGASLDGARARASYRAMQHFFHRGSGGLYSPVYPAPAARPESHLWPFSQALAATVALAQLPGAGRRFRDDVADRLHALRRYWNGSRKPAGYDAEPLSWRGSGDEYYDDNAWIGLELVTVSRLFGDAKALSRARQLFRLIAGGWDRTSGRLCPGGVYWARTPAIGDRNTVSTASAAKLGAELYLATKNRHYLRWAATMYSWVRRCLAGPNGLFWDHIDAGGHVDRTQWSYNQGAMIGAAVLLFRATRNPRYLVDAQFVADAAVASFRPFAMSREPPYFLAIFFNDLSRLARTEPASHYDADVRMYATNVWKNNRDPATGLFHFGGRKQVQLLEQAAMVRVYADLAEDSSCRSRGSSSLTSCT